MDGTRKGCLLISCVVKGLNWASFYFHASSGTELSFLLFTCIFKGLNRASFYFYASSSSSSSFDSFPISFLDGNLSFHSSLGPLLFTTSFEFSLLQTGMLLLNESNIFPRRVFSLKKIMSLSPCYFHAFSRD